MTFIEPLSAPVGFVCPQLSAGETPLPGLELGQVQDEGAKALPPPVGTDGDHRHVGKPG